MKKSMIIVLAIVILSAVTFTGCSQSSSQSTNTNQTNASNSGNPSNDAKKEVPGEKVGVVIGSASGAAGSTVTIPVSFKEIPSKGIGSCNFNIKYDTNILEAVEVLPGDGVEKNSQNFDSSIINVTGMISFLFTISNDGKDAISKDGVFANVKFTIKKDAAKGVTKVTKGTAGSFGDTSMGRVNPIFTEGEITVN